MTLAEVLPRMEVYVVTTPQPAAQRVAQRSALAARKLSLSVRGVIENMSWFVGDDGKRYEIFGQGGGESLASELNVPLMGQIPLSTPLREGGDSGHPVTTSDADATARDAFTVLAAAIAKQGPTRIYRPELSLS
jgi:ATP-binding protein involved in chromosome partitioning